MTSESNIVINQRNATNTKPSNNRRIYLVSKSSTTIFELRIPQSTNVSVRHHPPGSAVRNKSDVALVSPKISVRFVNPNKVVSSFTEAVLAPESICQPVLHRRAHSEWRLGGKGSERHGSRIRQPVTRGDHPLRSRLKKTKGLFVARQGLKGETGLHIDCIEAGRELRDELSDTLRLAWLRIQETVGLKHRVGFCVASGYELVGFTP